MSDIAVAALLAGAILLASTVSVEAGISVALIELMNVSTSALWGSLGVLALLFAGKMAPKLIGVYPLARR